jgi:hypothetical protein
MEVTEVSQELLVLLPVDLGPTSRPSSGLAAALTDFGTG